MSLLKAILETNDGGAVKALAQNFGLSNVQAGAAVAKLLPALTQGMKSNVSQQGGLDALLGALNKGNHQRYVDNPTELTRPDSIADGNNILGHLLGNKDVSRQVASQAAEQTGIDTGVLKKMLPMVAGLAMGSLSPSNPAAAAPWPACSGATSKPRPRPGGFCRAFWMPMADGSMADDLLGMVAKKFF